MSRALIWLIAAFLLAPLAAAADDQASRQQKVLVVLVFDQTCKVWCAQVRPLMKELAGEFGDRIQVAELDATASVLPETKKAAKELGVLGIFKDVMDYVPVVLIVGRHGQLIKELTGPKSRDVYRANVEKALNSR